MNLFWCDEKDSINVKSLDDARLVKIVLECAQMLSTPVSLSGLRDPVYKPTHVNHPMSLWVRWSKANYARTIHHFEALCTEYTERFGREHKSAELMDYFLQFFWDNDWELGSASRYPNCTDYKQISSVFLAYQLHLIDKWKRDIERDFTRGITWTNSLPADWVTRLFDTDSNGDKIVLRLKNNSAQSA